MVDLNFSNVCRHTLSANEIRQFCDCPRKRYYASRDCLAIRTNVKNKNLELGRAIHLTLEYYYTKLDKLVKEAQLEEPTEEQCKELLASIPEYQLSQEEATLGLADTQIYNCIIENYKEQIAIDLTMYEIIGCETSFSLDNWPIEDVMYHGNIDMIVRDRCDQLVYFFEHKTCKDFRPEIYDRFDIQLHIYADYGIKEYGSEFGGMILNQLKKAKTIRGYANDRKTYVYSIEEQKDFDAWLTLKTKQLVSPENLHAPCNNYMSCKMCEYAPICLKYGYKVPTTTDEIIKDDKLVMLDDNGESKPMFMYDPRTEDEVE